MRSLVAHRINTIIELLDLDHSYGLECDLRDHHGEIVLHHDPFIKQADTFSHFCANYKHGMMILNIKSEGIEPYVIDILKRFSITQYVFLDSSFPMIVKHSRLGMKKFAIRISEFESFETIKSMKGLIDFVWVDNFGDFKYDPKIFDKLKNWGFQTILVSPELHGRVHEIDILTQELQAMQIVPDFICTKREYFHLWKV